MSKQEHKKLLPLLLLNYSQKEINKLIKIILILLISVISLIRCILRLTIIMLNCMESLLNGNFNKYKLTFPPVGKYIL